MSGDEGGTRRPGDRFAAASTSGIQGGRSENAPRDRDPAPGYDGENPEVTFRQYEKQVALWEFETEVVKAKRGVKLLRQLSGVAATAVDDLEIDEIACEQGVKNVMSKLRDYFMPHLEVSLPRAFEAAVYGQPRGAKETFGEYTKRMERAFVTLAKEGVDLPDGAKGYILYRQAALNESQEQRLLTWAEGKYGRKEITTSLRRLDKVIREKEKAKGSYVAEESFVLESAHGNNYDLDDKTYQEWDDEEDENYILLADGDLDEIMDEQDVMSALASYHDTRQALKDQRLNRGYFPGLVGFEPLHRLERELSNRGLRIKWAPKKSTAKGVGGTAVVEGVALIPIGIGGINGILETTVVQGDVPLLLPIKLLRVLEVSIKLKDMVMNIPAHHVSVPLRELASGHVTVNVMSFSRETRGGKPNASYAGFRPGVNELTEAGPADGDGRARADHDAAVEERAGSHHDTALPDERQSNPVPGGGGEAGRCGQPRTRDPPGEVGGSHVMSQPSTAWSRVSVTSSPANIPVVEIDEFDG